jgi:hypothetical protein
MVAGDVRLISAPVRFQVTTLIRRHWEIGLRSTCFELTSTKLEECACYTIDIHGGVFGYAVQHTPARTVDLSTNMYIGSLSTWRKPHISEDTYSIVEGVFALVWRVRVGIA